MYRNPLFLDQRRGILVRKYFPPNGEKVIFHWGDEDKWWGQGNHSPAIRLISVKLSLFF
jgi:hypothetical protein